MVIERLLPGINMYRWGINCIFQGHVSSTGSFIGNMQWAICNWQSPSIVGYPVFLRCLLPIGNGFFRFRLVSRWQHAELGFEVFGEIFWIVEPAFISHFRHS